MLAVGRQGQVSHVLPGGRIERLSLLVFLAFLFLFFALLGTLAHGVEQSALFLLQILLTVGAFRRGSRRGRAGANISKLFQRAAIKRHHVKIIQPGEIDVFLIEREVGVGLGIDCAGDLPGRSALVIVDEDVAFVGEDGHCFVFRQLAVCGRRLPGFILGQAA